MATILEDIAQVYLPSIGALSLTFGTNLFAGLMPDGTDEAGHDLSGAITSVDEYPGEAPIDTMGERTDQPGAPQIARPHIQVMCRGVEDDYLVARRLIDQIDYALRLIVNTTVNGTLYYRIESIQDPFLLYRDERRRPYFVCNFRCHRHPVN